MDVVSDSFIDLLNEHFFVEPKFIRTDNSNKDWKEISRSIQPREIRSHFLGNYSAGFICRNAPTNITVFDLDCHSPESKKSLIRRKEKVLSKFGNPDFIYTSPNSGLHLYYFLDAPYHPKEIQQVVKNSIRIKTGEIEFFPNGHGNRLFGNPSCQLLDNNLKSICIDPEEYIQNVWDLNPRLNFKELKSDMIQKRFSKQFISDCEHLIRYGLKQESMRNNELMQLSRYYQGYKKLNPLETEKMLCKWISTKNNGRSRDWNRNQRGVYKHIHEIVIRFDADKMIGLNKYSFPRQILSNADTQFIHAKALTISDLLDKSLDNITEFLKDLISYCKYNIHDGIVEIPKRVFQNCKYGSGTRYVKIKDALIKTHVIVPIKNYSTTSHKCIIYKLLFNFE